MIDTIKIAVYKEFNMDFYNVLLYASDQKKSGFYVRSTTGQTERKEAFIMKVNNFDNYEQLIINGSVKIPSYNYNIHWRCYEDRVTFEFSIPKMTYGNNSIELQKHFTKNLNSSPYELLITGVKSFFNLLFPLLKINYGGVEILRYDLCYNQIYNSREESLKALNYIKLKHQGRGDRLNFEYGYIELSKNKYFKIYHKGEEYKKHDFNKIDDVILAKNLLEFSDRILRYEKKFTSSNWSYFYNLKYKMRGRHSEIQYYYDCKNNKEINYLNSQGIRIKKVLKVNKEQRRDFESKVRFTVDNSLIYGAIKLDKDFFNVQYKRFRNDIKKRYSIGNSSIKILHNEVIDNKKNKTMNVRILSYIKVFKSLKRAQESGAFSLKTLYRYEKHLKENNLSSTKVKSNIYQCWNHNSYYKGLQRHFIIPYKLTQHLGKYRNSF